MRRVLLVGALALLPGLAQAHEVLSSVERGRAIAVKAFFADGEVMAYTEYQVFSPVDAKLPYQKGRTDRAGYLAFVPDAPGNWHVRIADNSGHGLELDVPFPAPGQDQANGRPAPGIASWAFVVRPLVGALAIVAIFLVLVRLYRRKGAGP
jgi:nickel transport protein